MARYRMPIYQRQTNPCVIDTDPGTATRLSRIKQSVTVTIADLWGIRRYPTNRLIAIHSDIEPLGFRNKRHGTHQFAAGILWTHSITAINIARQQFPSHPPHPPAIAVLQAAGDLADNSQHCAVQYLNNVLEQDHRAIKRRINASQHFYSFWCAWRTIAGYEAIHMIRKGQAYTSNRDVEELLAERGLHADHRHRPEVGPTPPQKFSADCDRGSNRPTTVGGWTKPTSGLRASGYIYTGLWTPPVRRSTSFCRQRDVAAAERFLAKALGGENHPAPRVINIDKHAAYPPAIAELKADGVRARREL